MESIPNESAVLKFIKALRDELGEDVSNDAKLWIDLIQAECEKLEDRYWALKASKPINIHIENVENLGV